MIVVHPDLRVAYKLGLVRQLQVVGFLLSIMNQCLRSATPRLFLIIEAQIGRSVLQNYDASLRNSVLTPNASFFWRILLLVFIALPLGLSVAYKDFQLGHATSKSSNSDKYYGMTGPAGLEDSGQWNGLSLMSNASLPFMLRTYQDTDSIDETPMPLSFGFNGLLLSNTSAAFLDGPMPEYVSELQQSLGVGESYELSAQVRGTVTRYNNTVESHRDVDDDYWKYYDISKTTPLWMYNGWNLGMLFNQSHIPANQSWMFLGLYQTLDSTKNLSGFASTAMQFSTRREQCEGRWKLTFDSIKLIGGSCDYPPLLDKEQNIYANAYCAFDQMYLPTLSEFLEPFAFARSESSWQLATYTTAVAGMYCSRATSLNGYQAVSNDLAVFNVTFPLLFA